MKLNALKTAAAMAALTIIAACGGSGSGDGGTVNMSASLPSVIQRPTVWTVDGRRLNSCAFYPGCSGNPYAPFTVWTPPSDSLPPDGATLSGFVRLQAGGIALANVELLPATGYLPKLGIFAISRDQTNAWLDLDTRQLPNGPIAVRVAAFNAPAGQAGVELTAMPPRTWFIRNDAPPPQSFTANLVSAPPEGSALSGTVRLELLGSGITNAELLPVQGYEPKLGQFNISSDKTYAWLDLDTRSIPDGLQSLRISAFNVAQGQPNGAEIIVMPPRTWRFANGATPAFTATVTSAPVHGEFVRGTIVLEVRGTGMKNIELLPQNGYEPKLGRFTTTYDGTFGYLELDTTTLPNGPLVVRVSAFDAPAGQPGKEIFAMPGRLWYVAN